MYKDFPYTLFPNMNTSSIISLYQNGTFVLNQGWPSLTHRYHPKSITYLKIQSWFYTVYGGGGLVGKSCPTLVTTWAVACQALLSIGFPRQEYWSGLPFPSPEDLPNPEIEPRSPALQADSLPTDLQGNSIQSMGLDNSIIISICYYDIIQIFYCSKNLLCSALLSFPFHPLASQIILLNPAVWLFPECHWVESDSMQSL